MTQDLLNFRIPLGQQERTGEIIVEHLGGSKYLHLVAYIPTFRSLLVDCFMLSDLSSNQVDLNHERFTSERKETEE